MFSFIRPDPDPQLVLRIRDIYTGSEFFSIPDQNFFHLGSQIRIKEFKYFNPPKMVSKLSEIWFGLFLPDPDLLPNPDPGSRVRLRNTVHNIALSHLRRQRWHSRSWARHCRPRSPALRRTATCWTRSDRSHTGTASPDQKSGLLPTLDKIFRPSQSENATRKKHFWLDFEAN